MTRFGSYCDDYYVNMHLHTEMDLPQGRETLLHFFEQLQRKHPTLRNFFTREREHVLEEDKDAGHYRWAAVEPRRLAAGYVNPDSPEEALKLFQLVLGLAPFELAVSSLDCESLNVMYGFDFTFRGNHSQLLAETLGVCPALEKMTTIPGATILGGEPMLQLALDEECRTQMRVHVESRTTAHSVKLKEFPEEQFSVYLTVRRYGSLDSGETFVQAMEKLANKSRELVDDYLVENVLGPLRQAIAIQ